MKRLLSLVALCILSACAAPAQTAPGGQTAPTAAPAIASTESSPIASPSLAQSVLLLQWQGKQTQVLPVEAETGRPLAGYPPIPAAPPLTLSADGRALAAVEVYGQSCEPYAGGSACRPGAAALHLVDLAAWRDVTIPLPGGGWVGPAAFSPDGKQLALAYNTREGSAVLLADAVAAEITAQRELDFRPSLVAFGAGGASLIVYGTPLGATPGVTQPDPPRLAVLDRAGLAVAWEQTLADVLSGDWCVEHCEDDEGLRLMTSWQPAVTLSPDGRNLYFAHADADRLTTVDLESRQATTLQVQAAQSWFERLLALTAGTAQAKGPLVGAAKLAALSADGTRLYVTGQTWNAEFHEGGDWEPAYEWLALQEIETQTGRVLAERPAQANELTLTADGQYLVMHSYSWEAAETRLVEADGLAAEHVLEGWQVTPARRVGGQPILLAASIATDGTALEMGVVDERSFQIAYSWPAAGQAAWLAAP